MMKIKLNETADQMELIRAMGSRSPETSRAAMEAFAGFIGPVLQQVINTAGTASLIYTDSPFDEDDSPSYPLDLYYNEDVNYISTWSQTIAGGLPTNQVEGVKEMKISTYRLDSAISWAKKFARKSRLDVISKSMERLAQEILIKQERNGWAVALKALAEARTRGAYHTLKSTTQDVFQVDDLSRLMTKIRRLNASFSDGTPSNAFSNGITDLIVSPEIKEQIRGFAYNPMNTRVGVQTSVGTPANAYGGAVGIPLPESVREQIFKNAGASEIFGVSIMDILELGKSKKYQTLFKEFAGSDTNLGWGAAFDDANDELLLGFDLSKEAFIRPIARQAESGGSFVTLPDDQFLARSDKQGLYGFLEEGRACIDARAVVAIVV